MAAAVLLVPIHLDALQLNVNTLVRGALADFSKLPYFNGSNDINTDTAFISENIVSDPFQNQDLLLKEGVHLHWALPDALTREKDGNFSAVPNRWLITRIKKDGAEKTQWIVESDYLHPEGEGIGNISFPLSNNQSYREKNNHPAPFRNLGRKIPLAIWKNQPTTNPTEYLPFSLTAVGYGEPTFASFYPNCHSVFGFHDVESPGDETWTYELFGWYDTIDKDCLAAFIKNYKKKSSDKSLNEEIQEAIKAEFNWEYPPGVPPGMMCCYASITTGKRNESPKNSHVEIAVGNTGTEALSALLAKKMDKNGEHLKLEDQLEAFLLAPKLENRKLDIGPKFQEARHEKEFMSISGGIVWSIQKENENGADPSATEMVKKQIDTSWMEELTTKLNQVNQAQQEYYKSEQKVESMRRQLFSDWYKYMICAYPPPDNINEYPGMDEVISFIENKGLNALQIEQSTQNMKAGILHARKESLGVAIQKYNAAHPAKDFAQLQLKSVAGPRFWQPSDPVILISGEAASASVRHGYDGLLKCIIGDGLDFSRDKIDGTIISLSNIINKQPHPIHAPKTEQPWHPQFLEWEVEVFSDMVGNNHTRPDKKYSPDFITDNYVLHENAVDLTLKTEKGGTCRAANVYRGVSILTAQAQTYHKKALERFLLKCIRPKLMSWFFDDLNTKPPLERNDTEFKKHYQDFVSWSRTKLERKSNEVLYTEPDLQKPLDKWFLKNLESLLLLYEKIKQAYIPAPVPGKPDPEVFLSFAIKAYTTLNGIHCLSQSLGGFNEALLMHQQTLQLPIADPLGFPDYEDFASLVAVAVGKSIISSPEPLNDFNPIRNGKMLISRLRLVDSFGQNRELDIDSVISTGKMTDLGSPGHVLLTPRLSQPACLNFRWLSARNGQQEMNDHPDSTPICGWITANHLESSLDIYNEEGIALGKINQLAHWEAAPGHTWNGTKSNVTEQDIPNPFLRKFVERFLSVKDNQSFLKCFLAVLDNTLENISPDNHSLTDAQALLMGRPLALVRASLSLDLKGLPAIHQGWDEFRLDMQREERETDGFEKVTFPVRIGEYKQLHDGVVGYWKENEDTTTSLFYAVQTANNDDTDPTHPAIITRSSNQQVTINLSVDSPPQVISILMDPMGKVHATSGILPIKIIDLPARQYQEALQRIEISFLTGPLLFEAGKINLSLPEEAGYQWQWLEREKNSNWVEVSQTPKVKKAEFGNQLSLVIAQELKAFRWIEFSNALLEVLGKAAALPGIQFTAYLEKVNEFTTVDGKIEKDQFLAKTGDTLIELAWLLMTKYKWILSDAGEYIVAEIKDREIMKADLDLIANILQSTLDLSQVAIEPVNVSAHFSGCSETREGWIKMKHTK